mgnify:CR=1 FL=1
MPNQKISWQVYAERNDAYLQQFPEKRAVEINKDANDSGKYLMPELFNQPKEKGIYHQNNIQPAQSTTVKLQEENRLEENKEKNNSKEKNNIVLYEKMREILYNLIIFVIVIGFIHYAIRQYINFGSNFSFIKLLLYSTCSNSK